MWTILYTLMALFLFTLLVTPIVILVVLLIRTNKPKTNPNASIKLEQLEQNDYNIVDDVNKAFHDVSQSIQEIQKKLDEIEERMDRDDNTIKGFSNKK